MNHITHSNKKTLPKLPTSIRLTATPEAYTIQQIQYTPPENIYQYILGGFTMDNFEKEMGFKREPQTIKLTLGTPNTAEFLQKQYEILSPMTADEYHAIIDDLQAAWDKGERTMR